MHFETYGPSDHNEIVHELPLPLNDIDELPWTFMKLKLNVSLEGHKGVVLHTRRPL